MLTYLLIRNTIK